MSVESITIALHHSRATGTAKLVLIGIANHDGDGGAWPSVATLARYAGTTARNVQKALARLTELGEIRRIVQGGGNFQTADHMRPNLYHFTLGCPPACDRSKSHRVRHTELPGVIPNPPSDATPPVASDTRPPSDATPEPSYNHPSRKKKERHVGNRAREDAGPCGHAMIDDRHCILGCPIVERGDA